MILEPNRKWLTQSHVNLLNYIEQHEEELMNGPVQVIPSKKGAPTVYCKDTGAYLHSQYDPENEAARFLEQYEDIENHRHIFIYGLGLWYNVEILTKRYPDKFFYLYEPNKYVFYQMLCTRNLALLPQDSIKSIFLEIEPEDVDKHVMQFLGILKENVLFIHNPSYQRVFEDRTFEFTAKFTELLRGHTNQIRTNYLYEKLWTVNSVLNFQKVLHTQSLLREKASVFRGKPAILVAAGPSLEDELDHLKYIKDNRLAYIFAVGSANKVLFSNGIYPDAVCSYDPNVYNHTVFEEVVEAGVADIPMIFGSTVGYETLEQYQGPLLHMITSQDYVFPFYFGRELLSESGDIISDAPSIANLMLEILGKMECSYIFLVGQNLANKKGQYYSQGVRYEYRTHELTEQEIAQIEYVECTDGGVVDTLPEFNLMRLQLERTIKQLPPGKVINTTRGGAKINGTAFMPLSEAIEHYLKTPVVEERWYEGRPTEYDLHHAFIQLETMEKDGERIGELFSELHTCIEKVGKHLARNQIGKCDEVYRVVDVLLKEIVANNVYQVYLQPMIRVQAELFSRSLKVIRGTTNERVKAKLVYDSYTQYIADCKASMLEAMPMIQVVHGVIRNLLSQRYLQGYKEGTA